jgi:putative hydroxymethylpyrimidine transport system permease protein
VIILLALAGVWQAVVWISGAPAYILPEPARVAAMLAARWPELLEHGGVTLAEILLGLVLGTLLGIASALIIAWFRPARHWLMPVLVVSGLRRTEPGWLDLARTMGGSRLSILRHIRIPAALPALTSGLRVATAVAPIGAVVGEWVGSSGGLGYLMLQANARMQIDLMFAALFVLGVFAVGLYYAVDWALRRILPWQVDDAGPTD